MTGMDSCHMRGCLLVMVISSRHTTSGGAVKLSFQIPIATMCKILLF